uniref:Uncharacterized protein n=1 Tax=Candidatus Kentrum sp. TUN TaxID=2126343 RepID=A0A450ZJR6_9GAMM|nr:MAG: hypothetical protein BECKTUN1418E_GA0071001_100622 [Candidatus Kentron sp. TUN]VFK54021.1 MAG: hypothetical protein BECKTUN1418F_GA0071002_10363 [Candidatus Kentron sp. TUN]
MGIVMSDHEVKKRVRGIEFDSEKVRHYAGKTGIENEEQLEIAYLKHPNADVDEMGVVKKAWNGKRVDKKYARILAECLGLSDYRPLEKTEPSSLWNELITEKKLHGRFMHFILEEVDEDSRLFTILSDDEEKEVLPRHPSGTRWYLVFDGKRHLVLS